MTRPIVAGLLVLGLAACRGEAPNVADAQDMAPGSLPTGTRLSATIQTALSSRSNKAGDSTDAVVSRNVMDAGGAIAIPAGSRVTLVVAQIEAGTDQGRPEGQLDLVARSVAVGAQSYPLAVTMPMVPHHMEWRDGRPAPTASRSAYRDVIVSAGTPVVLTLAKSLKVSAK